MRQQHGRIFSRWRCTEHDAGSYNFNNMHRHIIDDLCVIVIEDTVGVIKPKTFGGYNGDVSRKFLPEWENIQKQKQMVDSMKAKFDSFRKRQQKRIYRYRRNDKNTQRIFRDKRKEN